MTDRRDVLTVEFNSGTKREYVPLDAHERELQEIHDAFTGKTEIRQLRAILDAEAIDRAARVLYESNPDQIYADEGPTWDAEPEPFKENYREQARAVLRAAGSPAIRQIGDDR